MFLEKQAGEVDMFAHQVLGASCLAGNDCVDDAVMIVVRAQDRACPNCAAHAGWLTRRSTKRWEELAGRDEAEFSCPHCSVRWTIYLEPTGLDGAFDPLADPRVCRPRWR